MIEITGNEQPNEEQEFYDSFRINLDRNHNFPEDYMYKFIILNNKGKLTEIFRVFDDIKYSFTTRESSNGKYLSCTIVAFVMDSNQVIELYKKVAKIEGVIML